MKSAGKRSMFRLTCSSRRFVSTPYRSARSSSSIACRPRATKMRFSIAGAAISSSEAVFLAAWLLIYTRQLGGGLGVGSNPLNDRPEQFGHRPTGLLADSLHLSASARGQQLANPFGSSAAGKRICRQLQQRLEHEV